ncbi:MAG: circadian clock KaiB family protein [Methanobacterium sp.]
MDNSNVDDWEGEEFWEFRLYVTGKTPRSLETFDNLKELCEAHLKGNCNIEVLDLRENPELAKDKNITAIPTLIKELPPPIKRVIGTLANEEKVLVGLEIIPHR